MPAYMFVIVRQVLDADRYAEYVAAATETLHAVGASVHGFPGPVESLEGPAVDGVVVVEFRDLESAQWWFNSEDYQAVRELRQGAVELELFLADLPSAFVRPAATVSTPSAAELR